MKQGKVFLKGNGKKKQQQQDACELLFYFKGSTKQLDEERREKS